MLNNLIRDKLIIICSLIRLLDRQYISLRRSLCKLMVERDAFAELISERT